MSLSQQPEVAGVPGANPSLAPRSMMPSAVRVAAARIARGGFRLAVLLFAARVLTPQEYGTYGLLFTVNETLMFLSGGGFLEYVTRESARYPQLAFARARQVTQLRFAYVTALVLVGWLVMRALAYPQRVLITSLVFSLCLYPRGILDTTKGLLRGAHRFTQVLLVELMEGGVLLIAAVLLLKGGGRLWSLIVAELLAACCGAALSWLLVRGSFKDQEKASLGWREIVRRTFAFNVYSVIVDVYDRVDVIILSKLSGDVAVAMYVIPYRILPLLQVVPYGLMSVALVVLSKHSVTASKNNNSEGMLGVLYAAALLFVLLVTPLADFGVHLLLGPSYAASASILKVLIWAAVPQFMNLALNTILLANHREKWFMMTASVCMVVNISVNIILVPKYSYMAAAGVTILTELVLLVQNVVLVRKAIGYIPRPHRFMATSVTFAVLFAGSIMASRVVPSILVAAVAGTVFFLLLYPKLLGRRSDNRELGIAQDTAQL